MAFFTFGPWRPDLAPIAQLDDTLQLRLAEATNVVPDFGCYQPQSEAVAVTNALTLTCQGVFACTDIVGNVNWFAGTTDTILRISSDTATWSTVGVGYALTDEDTWEFVRYGNQVFAAAPAADLQFITMSAGSSFAAVGGAPPRFRHLAVARNFLVGAGTATNPQRLQWSALDNPQSWTLDVTTQADFQDLLGPGGWNQGIVAGLGGADAVIFQERAVWRMLYVGPPLIFQLDPVESARGAIPAGSIVHSAGYAFYYSDDGFYQFDGTTSTPIGVGKVDAFFAADVENLLQVSATADADRPLIMWGYRSKSSTVPNRILVYNWQIKEWALITHDHQFIWRALSRHTAPYGLPKLACIDTSNKGAIFNGSAKAPSITTSQYQLNPRGRSFITQVYPVLESGAPYTEILHRRYPTVTLSSEPAVTVNALGFCPFRIDDRYFAFRGTMNAGTNWSKWRGVKTNPTAAGHR